MNNHIKAIIVDDEPAARNLIQSYLNNYQVIEVVGECSTGEQAVHLINTQNPDLIFLDIQMPNMTGFDVLKEISKPYPAIIFVTAFDDFAIKAFEVNAMDYVLKPFDKERFSQSIERALESFKGKEKASVTSQIEELVKSLKEDSKQEYKSKLIIKSRSKSTFIEVNKIECIEGYDNYVKVHTQSGYKVANYTLKELESSLNPQNFTRTHKSFLVNLKKIKALEPFTHGEYILYLESGKEVKLSRTYKEKLQIIIGK